MTKEARKSAYLEAKDNITNYLGYNFLCGQFSNILNCAMKDTTSRLPEFGLFEPTKEEQIEYVVGVCWFGYKDEEMYLDATSAEWLQMERLICLDLCLLMVEDNYLDE
jgi:hypothetical protein